MDWLLVDHPDFDPDTVYETSKGHALKPRRVDFGPYAGRYVLQASVKDDEHHEAGLEILRGFQIVTLDPDEIFDRGE